MPKSWRFAPYDASRVKQLCAEAQVSPLLAQILVARGYATGEQVRQFLTPKLSDLHEPSLLPGVDDAADRVVAALQAKRTIMIYGDYDVDGVTSTSLLWYCLTLAGATVEYYIPDRREEGYGLNSDAVREIAENTPDALVITVDCGIASVQEAALAKELGLELIITDHHQMSETIPEAAAVVHPRLPGTQYPFGELCGVGVAFKLAWAICQRLGDGKKASPRMREFLMSAIGLTAIGTIADVVPLVDENRIIVRFGLGSLAQRSSVGLKALMKLVELDPERVMTAEDIGYKIAPRINAAGRLKQARLAVELLTTDDGHRAHLLASYLNHLNRERQTLERRMLKQAKEMVEENEAWQEHRTLVLAHDKWHPGVIGIVANRVAEYFEKPTFMISLDATTNIGQGSGRSFAGFNLHQGLEACAEHLLTWGGHKAAAGLRVEAGKLDQFREDFNTWAIEHHDVQDEDLELAIDAEVRLADVTLQAIHEIDRLGPFGQANPSPIFAATGIEVIQPKTMGEQKNHLSVKLKQHGTTLRAIAFGRGEWAEELAQVEGTIAICFVPIINEFRGRRSVELTLKDWQSESES